MVQGLESRADLKQGRQPFVVLRGLMVPGMSHPERLELFPGYTRSKRGIR